MSTGAALTIKQLHDDTGPLVRRAGKSRWPIPITDRGEQVAVLGNPDLLRPQRRDRVLLPEYGIYFGTRPR